MPEPVAFHAADDTPRFTPLHAALAMTFVVLAFIVAQGTPGSLDARAVSELPADPTAGTQVLPLTAKPRGIPSPATAASIELERNGRLPKGTDTSSIRLLGIPSPATAASLAPQRTLPLVPDDGVTLPDTPMMRDAHAVDTHYDPERTLAMERPVERPVTTPGEAARIAELRSNYDVVDGGSAPAPTDANVAF